MSRSTALGWNWQGSQRLSLSWKVAHQELASIRMWHSESLFVIYLFPYDNFPKQGFPASPRAPLNPSNTLSVSLTICITILVLGSIWMWDPCSCSLPSFYRWRNWGSGKVGVIPSICRQSLERVSHSTGLLTFLFSAVLLTERCFSNLEMTTLLSLQFDLDLNYLVVSLDPDRLYTFFPLQRENRIGKTHPAPFLCPDALEWYTTAGGCEWC